MQIRGPANLSTVAAKDDYLIDTMLETGLLSPELVDEGRAEAEANGEGILDTLVKKGSF